MLRIQKGKQVVEVIGHGWCHSRNTDARITPRFIQGFGEGANSPKGTTKPGNAVGGNADKVK